MNKSFSSPTFDFLSSEGKNFPLPNAQECAHWLISVGESLYASGALHTILDTCSSWSGTDRSFQEALSLLPPKRKEALKFGTAVQVKKPTSELGFRVDEDGTEHFLYIGWAQPHVFWLHTVVLPRGHQLGLPNERATLSCTELDAKLMAELIDHYERYASSFAESIVWDLRQMTQTVVSEYQRTLDRLEVAASTLNRDVQLIQSVRSNPAKSGMGIEG